MLICSKITVVDDNADHLTGIKECLNELKLDCHTKLYEDEHIDDWQMLPGTRVLFLDQNLTGHANFGIDNEQVLDRIVEVIKKLICPNSGPYALILWAENPDVESLKPRLFERFRDENSQLLPVYFSMLKKSRYIDIPAKPERRSVREPERLKQDILDEINRIPQLQALLLWEKDVSEAVDAVLRSIVDLVPAAKRASNGFADEVGKILYRLSQAGAGVNRAECNPRDAISRILLPMLADRLARQCADEKQQSNWKAALTPPRDDERVPSVLSDRAKLNSAIHLSFQNAEISATELGAVIDVSPAVYEQLVTRYLGLTDQQLKETFGVDDHEWSDCKLRLVKIGASCDNAQPKPGPLSYLLAIEWLFANDDGSRNRDKKHLHKKRKAAQGSEWSTPILFFSSDENHNNPGMLTVFRNLVVSVPEDETKEWSVVYRLREELISNITLEYARFISRPGIISLPP